jgi:hypothetical protein
MVRNADHRRAVETLLRGFLVKQPVMAIGGASIGSGNYLGLA